MIAFFQLKHPANDPIFFCVKTINPKWPTLFGWFACLLLLLTGTRVLDRSGMNPISGLRGVSSTAPPSEVLSIPPADARNEIPANIEPQPDQISQAETSAQDLPHLDGYTIEGTWPAVNGSAAFKSGGKYGFLDETGALKIPPIFDGAWDFSEGLVVVQVGDKFGYADETGRIAIPAVFDAAWHFEDGLALIWMDGKYGYIDRLGRFLIPPSLDMADFFEEGLSVASLHGKFGYLDRSGHFAIGPDYDFAWPFRRGRALVLSNGERWYIDHGGTRVARCEDHECETAEVLKEFSPKRI